MRIIVPNYTFDHVAKTVTFTDYGSIDIENLFLILDISNNTVIYQPNQSGMGGTVSGNILTLSFNTNIAGFSNSDSLQIFYEGVTPISAASLPLPIGAATSANQTSAIAQLAAIVASIGIIGSTAPLSASEIGWVNVSGDLVAVSASNPLPVQVEVGSVVIGKVDIDQATPGVTNGVSVAYIGTDAVNTAAAGTILVGLADGSGNAVSSTDNALDVNVKNTVPISGSVTVDQGTSPWVISGSVTANAGTNLNTSLLALENGGNLTALNSKITVCNTGAVVLAAGNAEIGNVKNSGTFAVQATQSGTWNLNNISGTISLPSGASTSAKQPALGVAGTASGDVITVQGITGMTALKVDGSAATQPVSGTVTVLQGTSPWIISGSVTTTPSGTQDVNITQVAGAAIAQGHGTAVQAIRVELPTDGTGVVGLNAGIAEIGNVKNSGTFAVQAAQSGTWNITNISGTVSLPTGAATSVKQSDGSQKTQIVDAGGNVIAATSNALNVAIQSGSAVIGHVITDSGSVTNATLSAETTKVIGTVRTADGSGNLLTSNSSTYTAKFALDGNLLGTLGTAFSTAGKVDVKGADGDVFVRQATASSLNAQVVGAVASAGANTGNPVKIGAVFNTTQPTVTNGQIVDIQATARGAQIVAPGVDNFAVQATLTAETTKVIGTVNQGTSPWVENLTQIGSTNVVTAGVGGMLAIGGNVATNVAITANPINIAVQGVSAENTVVTTGRLAQLVSDLYGKLIVSPYAGRDNWVKGNASTTGTSDTSVVASAGGSLRNYMTDLSIANTGATTSLITIKDGSAGATLWQTIAPTGGGSNKSFNSPVRGTAATAIFFAAGSSSTTIYCSISAFTGA